MPQDVFHHLLGCGESSGRNWHRMLRVATAHAEFYAGQMVTFPEGILEADATKLNIFRAAAKTNTHCGRFLVIFHRDSPTYALIPLDDKQIAERRAAAA